MNVPIQAPGWDADAEPAIMLSAPDGGTGLARLVAAQAAAAGWQVVDLDAADGPAPVTALRALADELMTRFSAMSDCGASHFSELDDAPSPVLVVADRVDLLAGWDPLAALHLGMLARCGRAAGILLLATTGPGAGELPPELRGALAARTVLDGQAWNGLLTPALHPATA